MRTAHLDEIIRQKDPALKEVVEQLARGEIHAAVDNLDRQGRVQQIENREERFQDNRAGLRLSSTRHAGGFPRQPIPP